jgi:hypothetical protein
VHRLYNSGLNRQCIADSFGGAMRLASLIDDLWF